jgi:hypothetical protein
MSVQKIDSDGVPMVRVVGIASDFTDLDDVPGSYTSHANEILQVNASEDALAFTGVGSLAGNIDHGNLAGLSTGADHSYIDQDVTSGSSPTFDGTNFTGIPNGAMDETYINADGTVSLSANWDIGDGYRIEADEIRARDGAGLKLYDDGGNGIFVEDGGNVGIGTMNPDYGLDLGDANIGGVNTIYLDSSRSGAVAVTGSGKSVGLYDDVNGQWIVEGKEGGDVIINNGNVGSGTGDPDRRFHAADETATTDAILNIARIEAQCSGTATDGFGAGFEFEVETNGGQDVAGILAATWGDATHATRQSQLELWTNYQGDEVLSGVIVAPSLPTVLKGNARGSGAVDLQNVRSNASEVASGQQSAIIGGDSNTASGSGSVVCGGQSNTADGILSFTAGRQADTNSHNGVFIWADNENAAFTADRDKQFKARCSGGAHFVQNDTSAAIPVMTLEQEDIDEPFLKFIGDADASDAGYNLVDTGGITTTHKGWFKIEVQDEGNQITDGNYYVPFYELSSEG